MPQSEPSLSGFTDPVYYKRAAALQALLQALGDWDRDVRQAAAEALGRIADQRAVEPLKAALEDADGWVRRSVEQALRRMGWQRDANGRELVTASRETGFTRRETTVGRSY